MRSSRNFSHNVCSASLTLRGYSLAKPRFGHGEAESRTHDEAEDLVKTKARSEPCPSRGSTHDEAKTRIKPKLKSASS